MLSKRKFYMTFLAAKMERCSAVDLWMLKMLNLLMLVCSNWNSDGRSLFLGFIRKWFLTYQATDFRLCMIRPIRESALLGSPPLKFINNPNESSNNVVKRWTSFTKSTWPEFIQKPQMLVESQLTEADKALYRSGEYSLIADLSKF